MRAFAVGHVTWWEWHVLMATGFALVAWTARASYRRSASVTAAFGGLYLDGTLEQVDTTTGDALRAMVGALETGEPLDEVAEELRGQGLSGDEVALLERSAREVRRIEELFRPYVSPELAVGLEEAGLARLGARREVAISSPVWERSSASGGAEPARRGSPPLRC